MSVSTYLSSSTTLPGTIEGQTMFRLLGTTVAGTVVASPGVMVGSTNFTGGSIAVSCPGISASSVVIITGYNSTPNPANIWDININVPAQNFEVVSNPGVGQPFNYIVLG
jgi:hypothetical protein